MLRLMATVLLVLVSMVSASSVAAQDAAICGDVEDYFRGLDTRMFDEMMVLFTDGDWIIDMERMSKKANATDSGFLTLTTEEMQPFIDFITVPGDILLDFPEDEIPTLVEPLHKSATGYWLIMPAMLRSIGTGGIFAAMPFTEDLESLATENNDALADLTTACPELVARLESSSEAEALDSLLDEPGALDVDALKDMDVPEGFAFSLMTLPAEEDETE